MNEIEALYEADRRCSFCGKVFTVLHPTRWAYKKTNGPRYKYFCSWKCLRAEERGEERKPMAEEKNVRQKRDRREVLQGVLDAFDGEGMHPAQYMKEQGYTTPADAWHDLKTWSKNNAKDLYQKLVDRGLIRPKQKSPVVIMTDKLPGDAEKKEPEVELVYDPSIAEEYRKEQEAKAEREIREERGRRIAEGLDRADRKRREMIDGIETLEVAAVYSRVLEDATFKKINGGMALCGISISSVIMLSAYEWFRLSEEILVALRQLDATKPPEAE